VQVTLTYHDKIRFEEGGGGVLGGGLLRGTNIESKRRVCGRGTCPRPGRWS